jgi:hypothetical protein
MPAVVGSAKLQDGVHDFDFLAGRWSAHVTHTLNPFAGGDRMMELDGTIEVSPVWNGRGWLEQIEVSTADSHWGGLALFLYHAKAHQWSQTFVNAQSGNWAAPMIGEFRNGRGELYSQDSYSGRTVLVRGVWSGITPNAHTYTESLSDDGGTTWRPGLVVRWSRTEP